ncbi:MAG: CHRD domain-containing protein [Nitrospinae bacterium]|nr:CHRD domain-containing protein [Nitrospinota bacterium]
MKVCKFTTLVVAVLTLATLSAPALAELRATILVGSQEVPSVSTDAIGLFLADIGTDSIQLVQLIYLGLEGSVTAAHIHLGQRGVAGGVLINICGETGTPTCPAPGTPLTGTLTASNVPGITSQGVPARAIAEAIKAIRAGLTYVNIHSSTSPLGEIRGALE